jgi:hypothetical protein
MEVQELSPGTLRAVGDGRASLVVAMQTHLVVFDAPQSEAGADRLLDAARAKFGPKPVRYLILNDPAALPGLRPFLAQGAEVIVGAGRAARLRAALAGTRVVEVRDRYVLADEKREVELFALRDGALAGCIRDANIGYAAGATSDCAALTRLVGQ